MSDVTEQVIYQAVYRDRDLQNGLAHTQRDTAKHLGRVGKIYEEAGRGTEKFLFGAGKLAPAAFAAVGIAVGLAIKAVRDYAEVNDDTAQSLARVEEAGHKTWTSIGRDIAGVADLAADAAGPVLGWLDRQRSGAVNFIADAFRAPDLNAETAEELTRQRRGQEVLTAVGKRQKDIDKVLPAREFGNDLERALQRATRYGRQLDDQLEPFLAAMKDVESGSIGAIMLEAQHDATKTRVEWEKTLSIAKEVGSVKRLNDSREAFFRSKEINDSEYLASLEGDRQRRLERQDALLGVESRVRNLRLSNLANNHQEFQAELIGLQSQHLEDVLEIQRNILLTEQERGDAIGRINRQYAEAQRLLIREERLHPHLTPQQERDAATIRRFSSAQAGLGSVGASRVMVSPQTVQAFNQSVGTSMMIKMVQSVVEPNLLLKQLIQAVKNGGIPKFGP